MSFTETFLVQCLLLVPLPYILFAAFKLRPVMPLAVLAVLGCGIWMVGRDELASAHSLVFIFAIGICTSVTAMPVLGAILREMDLLTHHIGQLALSLAAMNDAALWVMLTLLLAVLGAPG